MHVTHRQRVVELRKRRAALSWVRSVWAARNKGLRGPELDAACGEGAATFCIVSARDSLSEAVTRRVRETEPCREELATVFDFGGTAQELSSHNREVRRRSALRNRFPTDSTPKVVVPGFARPRESRQSCSARVRGSRRNFVRSHSRGGDSGEDPGGEPEPADGHLRVAPPRGGRT